MNNPFEILESKISFLENILLEIKSQVNSIQLKEQTRFLTRKDVADLLQVDLGTVTNWRKKGVLTAHQIGGRIYYKLDQIEEAMIELKK